MNWPFVSRRAWQVRGELVAAKDLLIDMLRAELETQKRQNEELKALFNKTSQFEVVEQKDETVTLRAKTLPEQAGRAGWRARSAARSDATVPVPADSVEALERRVVEAGGKPSVSPR